MSPVYLRIVVASAVVVILLGLALLEIVSEHVRFDPHSAVRDDADEAQDRRQESALPQRAGGWAIGDVVEANRVDR
jgi:hypothetical protein